MKAGLGRRETSRRTLTHVMVLLKPTSEHTWQQKAVSSMPRELIVLWAPARAWKALRLESEERDKEDVRFCRG